MWIEIAATTIRNMIKMVIGDSKGKNSKPKESWWWNEEVQEKHQNEVSFWQAYVWYWRKLENQKALINEGAIK